MQHQLSVALVLSLAGASALGAWKDGEVQPASGATYVIPWKAPRSVGGPRSGGTWPF